MPDAYHIRIEKERLVFCAAHFITYNDDVCEPLHGHNYHVSAELHGPLEQNHYVVDFVAVQRILQQIVDELDHRVLLPTRHPTIHVESIGGEQGEVTARHGDLRWVFPRRDCVLLPMENTTAEMLARYVGGRLVDQMQSEMGCRPSRVRISVDECDGQWGVCDLDEEATGAS
ncbi:MAG: 6-pyruvoyl tetrahydropterin synthase family protein [Planctomycetota bacterium]